MSLEEELTVSNGGGSSNNDKVYLTIIAASSVRSKVKRARKDSICRSLFTDENYCKGLIKKILPGMDIPETFFNGDDCDMFDKLSRMIRASILQRHGVDEDYFCVFIMVFRTSCWYNIVNCSSFHGDQFPPRERILKLACEGEHSLPAGGRALTRLKIEDKEDNCAICLQGLPSGSDAARLPCSHVYHYTCIMEWFVKSGTCPLCRLPCSHTLLP